MNNATELNRFLARVEKRAYAMTLMSVKNPDDALDIVQDVMLRLAHKYAKKPAKQWPPLFYRMLQNRTTDFHRASTLRGRLFGWLSPTDDASDPLESVSGSEQDTPHQRHVVSGIGEKIQAALTHLPPRQRQAFALRAWEGMDVATTARAMGCSQGSVKTHYSRAVHSLRGHLEELRDD